MGDEVTPIQTLATNDNRVTAVPGDLFGSPGTRAFSTPMAVSDAYLEVVPEFDLTRSGSDFRCRFQGAILHYDQGISTQLRPTDDLAWIEFPTGVRTVAQRSRGGEYVKERLDRIESAIDRENGSSYPDSAIVNKARLFYDSMFGSRTPTPSVVPSEDGGISFVWHKGGFDLDIEVGDSEVYVCVYHRESAASYYGSSREHLVVALKVLESISNLP